MKIDCPHCGVHGSVDDSLAGRKLRCPKCSKVFLVTDDIVPDADESNLVHQEILNDPPETVGTAEVALAAAATATAAVAVAANAEDDLDSAEEIVAADEPESEEELEIEEDDIFEPAPVQPTAEDILAFADDEDEEDNEGETETSTCSACGQSFAVAFLEEIDSKLYCALCAPEDEEEADEEDELSFDSDEQESSVEDEDFLAFTGDDDTEDIAPAVTPDNLEVCAGCGESLHPQFLDTYEGKQYCALCLPEDGEESLLLSEEDESGDEEEIALEADAFDEEYMDSDSAGTLMADDEDDDDEDSAQEDETEVTDEDTDAEEYDEEGFPQEACSVCGEKFHKDFLQEIDSKLYCGVCQPEVIETVSTDVMTAFSDGDEIAAEEFENVEELQSSGADFTVGDTIKEAWQKTKGAKGAIWGGVFAMYLIIFGISFAGLYATGGLPEQGDPTTTMGVTGGAQLITSWLSMLFTGGLMLIGVRRALEQRVSWKMVFSAFSMKKVISMSIATFLQLLLIGLGFLLLVIPGIYLSVGYALTLPLILDKGLGPWEALETSRKAIHKMWWTVMGMYLVMMLLYIVSAIPLGLGLIWTVPMFLVLIGVLYARLFGYSDQEEDEEETDEEAVEEEDAEDEDLENADEDVAEDTVEESEKSL